MSPTGPAENPARAGDLPSDDRRPLALVTGGAVRVGRAICLRLAREGYDLAVHYRSSAGPAESLADEAARHGATVSLHQADLTDPEQVSGLTTAVSERAGGSGLDLLVNSASLFAEGSLLDVTAEEWDTAMAINARAPFLLVNGLAPALKQARGAVVNIVDLSAWQPWLQYPHHSVTKAALLQLTRVQARALAPEVRVNAVAPGAVLLPEGTSEEEAEVLRKKAVLKRLGSAEDVADAVAYLAGAGFVTGEVIKVDGGRTLWS
jgi:pteridine reductase